MADAIPIYKGEDFYVPYYEVKVQGRSLDRLVIHDIIQVTYKDNIDEIDSFEISINNWDAENRRLKFSDSDLFNPGREVELQMGYFGRNRLRRILTGEITSLQPSFPAGGQPTLTIGGLNVLHRLRQAQRSQAYENKTDSEIAREIGGRLGVEVITDPTAAILEERYPYIFQDNKYDIIFLMGRARQCGYELLVRELELGGSNLGVLYFGPSFGIKRSTYRLTYGRSLIEFQPTLTTVNQVNEVVVRGWDNINKVKIEGTATRAQITTRGVGDRGGQQAIEQSFKQRKEVIANKPVNSQKEAETLARETLEHIAKEMVNASGSTVGLPDLRAGCMVEIDGVGERFSGRYFIKSTTHTIGDGGYTTQFECRREET